MKKVKRFSMEPSPYVAPPPHSSHYSSYPDGLEARARFRHQRLMQDYMELHKEVEAKRRKLLRTNKKKLELLRVVKFLRGKLRSLSKNPSQRIHIRVKKQSLELLPLPVFNVRHQVPLKESNKVGEAPVPRATKLLDLNQIIHNDDDMDEFQAQLGPPRTDLPKTFLMKRDEDVSNRGHVVVDKRKISWQDHIAVRV